MCSGVYAECCDVVKNASSIVFVDVYTHTHTHTQILTHHARLGQRQCDTAQQRLCAVPTRGKGRVVL
jgi:hypothetical protein